MDYVPGYLCHVRQDIDGYRHVVAFASWTMDPRKPPNPSGGHILLYSRGGELGVSWLVGGGATAVDLSIVWPRGIEYIGRYVGNVIFLVFSENHERWRVLKNLLHHPRCYRIWCLLGSPAVSRDFFIHRDLSMDSGSLPLAWGWQ